MPIAKNAYLRFRIIDEIIAGRSLKRDTLLIALNQRLSQKGQPTVSAETLAGDIRTMKSDLGAPIKHMRDRGYVYTEEGFRLFELDLKKHEINALNFAIDVLQSGKNTAIVGEAHSVLSRIYKKLAKNRKEESVIMTESGTRVKGMEWLADFHKAIIEKKPLDVKHFSLRQDKWVWHKFSPYALRESRGLWYVIGYSGEKEFTINMGLDRISVVKPAVGINYREDPEFKLSRYFRHSVGITVLRGQKPETVKFYASTGALHFLEVQPLHPTQKITSETKDGAIVELEVYLSEELLISLMGLGSRVTVLEPPALVEKIRTHIDAMGEAYSAGRIRR